MKRPGRSAATLTRLSALYVSSVKYVRARSKVRDACHHQAELHDLVSP